MTFRPAEGYEYANEQDHDQRRMAALIMYKASIKAYQ